MKIQSQSIFFSGVKNHNFVATFLPVAGVDTEKDITDEKPNYLSVVKTLVWGLDMEYINSL